MDLLIVVLLVLLLAGAVPAFRLNGINGSTIILILLLLMLFGGLPYWGWHSYGYYPFIGLGPLVLILLILILAGKL